MTLVEVPQLQEDFTLVEEPQPQEDFTLVEEPQSPQHESTLIEEPQSPQHESTLIEETQQVEPNLLHQSPWKRRPNKPLHQRQPLAQPLIAIVMPQQHQQPHQHQRQQPHQHQRQQPHQHQRQQSQQLTSIPRSIPRVVNHNLLRSHGILDCSVVLEPLNIDDEQEVFIIDEVLPIVTGRRKRRPIVDPTYIPSRRISLQSIGWGETRVLRNLPLREVRNLTEDIELLNEWEAED